MYCFERVRCKRFLCNNRNGNFAKHRSSLARFARLLSYSTSHPLHDLGKWQTANNECDVPWKLNWDEIFHINTYFHQDEFLTWCRRKSLYLEVMAVCNSPTTCSWGHQFYICFQSTKWCSFQLKLRIFPLKHILMPIWFGKAAFKTFNYANLLTDWLFKKFSGNYHLEFSLCIF